MKESIIENAKCLTDEDMTVEKGEIKIRFSGDGKMCRGVVEGNDVSTYNVIVGALTFLNMLTEEELYTLINMYNDNYTQGDPAKYLLTGKDCKKIARTCVDQTCKEYDEKIKGLQTTIESLEFVLQKYEK